MAAFSRYTTSRTDLDCIRIQNYSRSERDREREINVDHEHLHPATRAFRTSAYSDTVLLCSGVRGVNCIIYSSSIPFVVSLEFNLSS